MSKTVKLEEIIKATSAEFTGDKSIEFADLAAHPMLAKDNELALVFDHKVLKVIEESNALAFIVPLDLKEQVLEKKVKNPNFLFVARPRYALKQVIDFFAPERFYHEGVHPTAIIDETVELDPSVTVGPFVYVGPGSKIGANTKLQARVTVGANVNIGSDCIFYSSVIVEDHVQIGSRVIINANSVIGSDGFSFVTKDPSNLEKMRTGDMNLNQGRQIQEKITAAGTVIIGDDVEIGSNSSVDRGTIGPTIISDGCKIDNLVQVAHNVKVGKDTVIAAVVGIGGSTQFGERVTVGGKSGFADGIKIGNDAIVGGFSGVNSSINPFQMVFGYPAVDYSDFLKRHSATMRLPKQQDEFKELKSKIKELEAQLETLQKSQNEIKA